MHPILDDLPFGNALEEQARAHTRGITEPFPVTDGR
jgi:hypothetical protein